MEIATTPMAQWSGVEGRPLIIAGPCAAETEDQLMETARRLQAARVDYLRAGIWKARTRPATFEGIGDDALHWLKKAGSTYGMRTATEVATAAHVESALRHGLDLIWIGARTTANPFSVQEIASALRGSAIPVLIKNPTSPDLALWIGAIERVYAAGVRSLGTILRGFPVAGATRFRNPPMWERGIELRRLYPDLPILADPSHIAGRRELIAEVSQTAMDLGLDGLIIEAHATPDSAWSDAMQQVTPERLGEILSRLRIPQREAHDGEFAGALESLREEIDHIDGELIDLLAERMRVVELIARAKQAHNVVALQVDRWRSLLEDRVGRGSGRGLSEEYVRALYEIVHAESVRRQSELMKAGPAEVSGTRSLGRAGVVEPGRVGG